MAEDKEVSETKQELSLVCSAEIVYSEPGDDVVLSCHLEPAISAVSMEIKWRNRADLVCHYKDGQMTESRGYEGRVSLSLQDLPNGKVSLTFRDIRTSQKGLYICEVIHEWQTLKEYIFLHVSSDFSLVVPSRTVSAHPGADVILPVHLSPAISGVFMKIRWYRDTVLIYEYMIGQEIIHFDNENRVGLSIQELRTGNLSLTLRNVQVSDSGDYTCKVFHDGYLQTGIIHLQVREFQKSDYGLDLEDLHNALIHLRTYDGKTRVLEETIKQIRKTLDHDGKDKKRKENIVFEEDQTTVDRHLREGERTQRLFLPFFGFTPRRTNSMEGLPPLMAGTSTLRYWLTPSLFSNYFGFTPRRTNSMEGLPPLMADTSTPREQLTSSLFSKYFGFTPRRTNSMEGLPPLMGDNSTLERHEMEERRDLRQNAQLGHVHSRLYAGENVSNMESESSSQNTRQTRVISVISPARDMTQAQDSLRATMQRIRARRQERTAAEQVRFSPAMSSQGLLRERTPESVLLQARAGIQAQDSLRATMQRIQASRQERTAAEQVRFSPAMSSQGLLRERTPESVLLQARAGIQAQDSLRATMQRIQARRQINTVTVQGSYSPAVQSQVQEQASTSQSVTSQARDRTQTQ